MLCQALHIFRKDVYYLRHEITLVLLVALAFALMHTPALHAQNSSWLAELALVATAVFLIGRLVLAEAIPGDQQFWITRPYRWQSLLAAKFLFIAIFVNLPVLLAHLFILIVDGFPLIRSLPGLLWEQVLLFIFLSLPFAAIATLNSGMAAFIFSQLIILAAAAGLWEMLPLSGPSLGGVAWVRESIASVALVAAGLPVIFLQYKTRNTVSSRSVAISGIAIGAVLFAALPWPLALALQSHLSKEPAVASSIQVGLGDSEGQQLWFPRAPKIADKIEVRLPILVQGIHERTEIQPDALRVSLRGADGNSENLSISDCSELKRNTISTSTVTISAVCAAEPEFFRRNRGQPVTVRGSLYLTLFGNARSQALPLSDQPANALDGLQCYTNVVSAEWDVYCRSAFRWPARLIYAKLGHTNANSFAQSISYSPFPAGLSIEPIETRWASAFASGPPPTVRDVTIVVEEPLAHLRRDFEARGVQLNGLPFQSRGAPLQLGVAPGPQPVPPRGEKSTIP